MIVEPIVLFNLLICLLSVWVSMVVNLKFLRPAILNKTRFAMYELRDRLAILAMRGVIDEESVEYKTLIALINNSISSTKDFRITRFLKIHSAIIADNKLREHLDGILAKIQNKSMPYEYRLIVSKFFELAYDLYEHKIWMLRMLLNPLIILVNLIESVVSSARKSREFLVNQRDRINKIENKLKENQTHFAI